MPNLKSATEGIAGLATVIRAVAIVAGVLILWRIYEEVLKPGGEVTADAAKEAVEESVETWGESGLMKDYLAGDAGMGPDSLVGAPPETAVYETYREKAAADPIMIGTGLPLIQDTFFGGSDSYTIETSSEDRFDEPTRRGGGRVT